MVYTLASGWMLTKLRRCALQIFDRFYWLVLDYFMKVAFGTGHDQCVWKRIHEAAGSGDRKRIKPSLLIANHYWDLHGSAEGNS